METNPFKAQRLAQERADAGRAAPAPEARPSPSGVLAWIEERMSGQMWYYRAPLLLILVWMYSGYPGDPGDPLHTTIFDGISLGFHEAGHAVFGWSGNRLLTVAGGTIFELGIPLVAAAYLLIKQRDPFGAAVCIFWLGTAFWHTAAYAGDARAQALPLVSPFGPVDSGSHDWTYMLMRFGKLSQDREIAANFRFAARIAMIGSLAVGAWLLWLMRRVNARAAAADDQARLFDKAEEDRLAAHLRGDRIQRPTDDGRRKRMSEDDRLREFMEGGGG
jgi:hypothetical protein